MKTFEDVLNDIEKSLKGIGQGDGKAQVVQYIKALQRPGPATLQGFRA